MLQMYYHLSCRERFPTEGDCMKNKKLEAFVFLIGGAAWVYVALTSGKPIFFCAAFPLLYLTYDLFMKGKKG